MPRGPGAGLDVSYWRHHAAAHDAPVRLHPPQRGAEDVAAGVVEVDVDAVGGRRLEGVAEVGRLVVDGDVEAELAGEQLAHLSSEPAMPTSRQPLSLAIWPTMWPTEPAAARHHDRLPRLRLADVEQPEVRRDPVGAEQRRGAARGRRRHRPGEGAWPGAPSSPASRSARTRGRPARSDGSFDASTRADAGARHHDRPSSAPRRSWRCPASRPVGRRRS